MSLEKFSTDFTSCGYAVHRLLTVSAPWNVMKNFWQSSPYFRRCVNNLVRGIPSEIVEISSLTDTLFIRCIDSEYRASSLEEVNPRILDFIDTNEDRIQSCLPYMIKYHPEIIELRRSIINMDQFVEILQFCPEELVLDEVTLNPPPNKLNDFFHYFKNVRTIEINILNFEIQNEDIVSLIEFKKCSSLFGSLKIDLFNIADNVDPVSLIRLYKSCTKLAVWVYEYQWTEDLDDKFYSCPGLYNVL